jgi:hypothetical protein
MPIPRERLVEIADAYVAGMTSIRGRRVHRLILRELAAYDDVRVEEGALIASSADGRGARCKTDGRGKAAAIARWGADGASETTSYDLLKDSLPIRPAGV